MSDDFSAEVAEAVMTAASKHGVRCANAKDGSIPEDCATFEVDSPKQRGWDLHYPVRLSPLPGGPSHMAHVTVAIAPLESRGNMRTDQLEHMFKERRRLERRIIAIQMAGMDPMAPPGWSLKSRRSTIAILRAITGQSALQIDTKPIYNGELEGSIAVGPPGTLRLRDDILKWSTDPGPSDVNWSYDDERGRLWIYRVNLPETTCQAVSLMGLSLKDIVVDDILGLIDTPVQSIRNEGASLIVELSSEWEWIAPVPEGVNADWR